MGVPVPGCPQACDLPPGDSCGILTRACVSTLPCLPEPVWPSSTALLVGADR
jgi:hypothetical protein